MSAIQKAAFDLVVLGGGSGGLQAAWVCASVHKAKVAVVDLQKYHGPPNYAALGGTCVNVGCVPKKLFVTAANYREHFNDSQAFGWQLGDPAFSWEKLLEQKNRVVRGINDSYTEMFQSEPNLSFFEGFGHLKSSDCVSVKESASEGSPVRAELSTKYVLLATGSWPFKPECPGAESCITSNEAFYLPKCPSSFVVVGGGYIAVEFAGLFRSFVPGDVHLVYRGELFLRGFDRSVRRELLQQMRMRNIQIHFNENPAKIEMMPDGSKKVVLESGKEIKAAEVMMATGRRPRSCHVGLHHLGVKLSKSGGVIVNECGQSSVPNIYAIGDVTDRIMLTPVAIYEANCFAATVFGGNPTKVVHDNIACAVFSIPQIGTVGMTEDQAVKAFPALAIYESTFTPLMHQLTRATYKKFLMKVIVDCKTQKVVGVHLCGPDAAEIIQVVGVAVKMGAKIDDFLGTIGVHPTSAENLVGDNLGNEGKVSYYMINGCRSNTPPPS